MLAVLILLCSFLPYSLSINAPVDLGPKERPIRQSGMTCYSCMSSYAQSDWEQMKTLYRQPMKFTDSCNEDSLDTSQLGEKRCHLCINIKFEDQIEGRIRYGYLRGCISDIINYNMTTAHEFFVEAQCRVVRLKDLFRNDGQDYANLADHDFVDMCSCHQDHCNAVSTTPAVAATPAVTATRPAVAATPSTARTTTSTTPTTTTIASTTTTLPTTTTTSSTATFTTNPRSLVVLVISFICRGFLF